MPEYSIVVVEPITEGNVGAIARVMKNFDVSDLRLVKPCKIGREAWQRAMRGEDILDSRKEYDTMEKALEDCSFVAGTSGLVTTKEKAFVRIPLMPWELAEKLKDMEGRTALVFGRENWGLSNEELAICDVLVNIPTSEEYPILNLSHAVAILLYELNRNTDKKTGPKVRMATGEERECLHNFFDNMLEAEGYPEHRREKTSIMFKRIIGRAMLTKWEFHTLSGVFTRASNKIRKESSETAHEAGDDDGQ